MADVQNRALARVTLDDVDLTDKINPRLISLTLCEKRGEEADQLDIVVADVLWHTDPKSKEIKRTAMAIPKEGAVIRVQLGWIAGRDVKLRMIDKGSFKVDDVEWSGPPDVITIRARSADLTDSYRVRRETKRRNTTLGKVVGDIAKANGLKASIAPELASIEIPVLAQDQRSDMALVRRLGRRHDAVATVMDGTLLFAPIGSGTSASGKPLPTFMLERRDGDRHRYCRKGRDNYAGVEARWHDQDGAQRRTVKVGGGAGKPKRLRRTFHREAEARHAAEAEDKRIRRGAAELDYTCALGRPDLYPEQKGTVRGFKPEIDATSWLITEATHTFDGQGGLTTQLKLETAI